jgi:hypothetical protein
MDPAFLYAEDVGPPGTTLDVEVIGAVKGKVKNPGGSKELVCLELRGHTKRLGLGATTAKIMTSLCGSGDFDHWRGWITLVIVNKLCRDPTVDGSDQVPTDVIRIAPQRPESRATAGLAARFDACADERAFAALDAEMRADWSRIPAADKPATTAAFKRAEARMKAARTATSSPTTSPDSTEQAEILRKEASDRS